MYVDGKSRTEIAEYINGTGFLRKKKNAKQLTRAHVDYILKNPIYVGDRHLQKQAPKNYMSHKPDPSQPYQSYYLNDTHEGIVSREIWDKVQQMLGEEEQLRKLGVKPKKDSHFLYGKIFCGECGAPMKRRTLPYNGEKVASWKCDERIKGNGCKNEVMKEDELIHMICEQLCISEEGDLEMHKDEIGRIILREKKVDVVLSESRENI